MKMFHFLLTRFNCPVGYAPTNLGIDSKWLAHRFVLFENFCLPSVLAQDTKNFIWIVLVDERTPEKWLLRLNDEIRQMADRVMIIQSDGYSKQAESTIKNEIKKITTSKLEIVITTRLDNDDAIARNYLSNIQNICQSLSPNKNYVIHYPNGCRLHKSGIYEFKMSCLTPFISVMSLANNVTTAFHATHRKMECAGTIINVTASQDPQSKMWLQTVHLNNITNRVSRRGKKIDRSLIQNISIAKNWESLL